MNKNNKLYGVGGWLLWFIIILVAIAPLLALATNASFINISEYNHPSLTSNSIWHDYIFFTWIFIFWSTIWQWYVGHHLLSRFEPASIAKVKTFLLIKPTLFFCKELYFLSQLGSLSLLPSIFFHIYTPHIIWLLYFNYSKRIKITYFSEQIESNDTEEDSQKINLNVRSLEEYLEDNFDEIKESIQNKVSLREIYDSFFNEVEQELFSFNEFKSICKKLYYEK